MIAFCAGLGIEARSAAAPPRFVAAFSHGAAINDSAAPLPPAVIRSRVAVINPVIVNELVHGTDSGALFNLFDDAAFNVQITMVECRSEDRSTCGGRLADDAGGTFIVSVHDGAIIAQFWSPTRGTYQVKSLADRTHCVIQQIDVGQLGGCANNLDQCRLPAAPSATQADSCAESIDVMVLYTPRARQTVGDDAMMNAMAHAAIATLNIAAAHSSAAAYFRAVHIAPIDYTESENLGTDLGRLQTSGDGFMDQVFALRAQHGADLVALLVESFDNSCGVGYVMTNPSPDFQSLAFSVIQQNCALNNLGFAHELAHNLGCQHDWADPSPGVFAYSHGRVFTGASGQAYRTVMAGSSSIRIPLFSNPLIQFDGVPTGVPEGQPNPADNACTISNTAHIVSAFASRTAADCNGNGASDGCDITSGLSLDVNENGVPDECDGPACAADEMFVLTAEDRASFDRFGSSVSMSDDRVVVGSVFDDDAGTNSGAAYVFRRAGARWEFESKIAPSDAEGFQNFGRSVAISPGGEFILAGAPRDGFLISDTGPAYMYLRNGNAWAQIAKLPNPDPQQADLFGWSVAWAGSEATELHAVAGAPLDDEIANDAGAAYVYRWNEVDFDVPVKLTFKAGQAGDRLGFSVAGAIDGSRIIAGAPLTDLGVPDTGAAHVFAALQGAWTHEAQLRATGPAENARLGWSVAIDGACALTGAVFDSSHGERAGAAIMFVRSSRGEWNRQHALYAADAAEGSQFGASVSLRGDRALIGSILDITAGSAGGAAFIFRRADPGWTQQAKITPAGYAPFDNFGSAVALAPAAALGVAGAHFDDHHEFIDAGSAHVFAVDIKQPDCNGNGVADDCDIARGLSMDRNSNGVPDECETCPADVVRDGLVNVNDLLAVINHWGKCTRPCPGATCVGDIVTDCTVDVQDLLQIVEQWGACSG